MFGMSKECEKRLILVFNACVRYVHKLRKYDHISHVSNTLIGCSLISYYKFRVVNFLFLLLQNRKPAYLFNKLTFARSVRTCNIIIPSNSCVHYNSSLFITGIMFWNSLPLVIKSCTSVLKFRSLVMDFIVNRN